ncbi:hypothetical protein B296_00015304 [Ensete ventricosum]|uniref:Uncharacterized protein n=1 Tax=Ensete ventricosum TaxID=4639 RepID=A0A427ACN7_ENSVE|nr:hypothetical protein B296_00015304 [Ensete ventricosum]
MPITQRDPGERGNLQFLLVAVLVAVFHAAERRIFRRERRVWLLFFRGKKHQRMLGLLRWPQNQSGSVHVHLWFLSVKPTTPILTRCQGNRCVVNRSEGLTAVDFGGGDAVTVGAIDRSKRQREKRCGRRFIIV